jgi:hypothetical protein
LYSQSGFDSPNDCDVGDAILMFMISSSNSIDGTENKKSKEIPIQHKIVNLIVGPKTCWHNDLVLIDLWILTMLLFNFVDEVLESFPGTPVLASTMFLHSPLSPHQSKFLSTYMNSFLMKTITMNL